jgi:hypothetical protein
LDILKNEKNTCYRGNRFYRELRNSGIAQSGTAGYCNFQKCRKSQGIAHGFQTLEENCEMLYLHSGFYSPLHQAGLRCDDPKIGIQWPLEVAEISEKDRNFPLLTSDFPGIIL